MQIAATNNRALSTFLLEMALDEAHIRERLAALLLAERAKRGGGDARRFPQPRMAALIEVETRAYQDWEAGVRIPKWSNLEKIAEVLKLEVADLVGDSVQPLVEEPKTQKAAVTEEAFRREVRGQLEAILAKVEAVQARLGDGESRKAARRRS